MGSRYVHQVAPVNRYAPRSADEMMAMAGITQVASGSGDGRNGIASGSASSRVSLDAAGAGAAGMQPQGPDEFFTFTVGKLDAGMAILIGERASQIEFPSLLLPYECTTGSVVRISVARNQAEEIRKKRDFTALQDQILQTYGREAPKAPTLNLRAVTQTSIVLEWEKLSLATAKLLSLDIFRNNERLAAIPNPLNNTSTKLSGLQVDQAYSFHLVMRTTAGTFTSNVIRTQTHSMTDTRGISVCFGHIDDPRLETEAKAVLEGMGARWSEKILIDTTHFVCTSPRGPNAGVAAGGVPIRDVRSAMYVKATQLSTPVVLPHWVFACAEQKRMVPISQFYIDKEPPNAQQIRSMLGGEAPPPNEGGSGSGSGSQLPPPPASKDELPAGGHEVAEPEHTQGEGREADPHPSVPDVEGPVTTTVALPSGRDVPEEQDGATDEPPVPLDEADQTTIDTGAAEDAAQDTHDTRDTQLSSGARGAGYENMDDISLGGESARGDDANSEVDLS